MLHIPLLQPVPNLQVSNLTYKISQNGALRLKDGRFLSRYTGNTKFKVDMNGVLRTNAEYKIVARGETVTKKKKPVETGLHSEKLVIIQEQISDNLSTSQAPETGVTDNISTKPVKVYRIHKKKVRDRIQTFINTRYGHYEMYFWTISFPEGTPDDLCFRALDLWLMNQRNKNRLHEYLWVTERQKNGTAHFHITIPHQMDVKLANREMKRILISFCKEGRMPCTSRFVGEKYNGVDIQKRKDRTGHKRITNFAEKRAGKALGNYLSKYVSKNDSEFEHLAWHNSRAFACMFNGVTFSDIEFEDIHIFELELNLQRGIEGEFFTWAPWATGPPGALMAELYEVNSYIQYKLGLFHPWDRGGKVKYQKQNKKMKTEKLISISERYNVPGTMSTTTAMQQVLDNETKMITAFVTFSGAAGFGKEFSDDMRLRIRLRVTSIGMQKEFADLLTLIDKEHSGEFFYTYHLYTYWAIDILNQVP